MTAPTCVPPDAATAADIIRLAELVLAALLIFACVAVGFALTAYGTGVAEQRAGVMLVVLALTLPAAMLFL